MLLVSISIIGQVIIEMHMSWLVKDNVSYLPGVTSRMVMIAGALN